MTYTNFIQNFVIKTSKQLSINMNVMNDKGIIIASSTPERIGTFHIGAYEMLQKKIPLLVTDDDSKEMIGVVPPGINLLLFDGAEPVGVLGVGGEPDAVLPIGKVIKLALETFIKQDIAEYQITETSYEDNKLVRALFFDVPENFQRISKLMAKRNLDPYCKRVGILICHKAKKDVGEIYHTLEDTYKDLRQYTRNDVLLYINQFRSIILKEIPGKNMPARDFIQSYIQEMRGVLSARIKDFNDINMTCYCGLSQSTMLNCRRMYAALDWLKKQKSEENDEQIIWLRDYLLEYLIDNTDESIQSFLFESYYERLASEVDVESFKTTISALIDSNMNLEETAKKLFVHRNTVLHRLKKIQNTFCITPLRNMKDAVFLSALYKYAVNKHR